MNVVPSDYNVHTFEAYVTSIEGTNTFKIAGADTRYCMAMKIDKFELY